MKHDWRLLRGVHPGLAGDIMGTQNSDVHQCRTCGQICLSEVEGPPDEGNMVGLLEACDLAVVRQVMTS